MMVIGGQAGLVMRYNDYFPFHGKTRLVTNRCAPRELNVRLKVSCAVMIGLMKNFYKYTKSRLRRDITVVVIGLDNAGKSTLLSTIA